MSRAFNRVVASALFNVLAVPGAIITLNIHFSESAFDPVWNDPEAGHTPGADCSEAGASVASRPSFANYNAWEDLTHRPQVFSL